MVTYDYNFVKLHSYYYNETVQCGGKKGDSVKIEQTGCSAGFCIHEIDAYYLKLVIEGKW